MIKWGNPCDVFHLQTRTQKRLKNMSYIDLWLIQGVCTIKGLYVLNQECHIGTSQMSEQFRGERGHFRYNSEVGFVEEVAVEWLLKDV